MTGRRLSNAPVRSHRPRHRYPVATGSVTNKAKKFLSKQRVRSLRPEAAGERLELRSRAAQGASVRAPRSVTVQPLTFQKLANVAVMLMLLVVAVGVAGDCVHRVMPAELDPKLSELLT